MHAIHIGRKSFQYLISHLVSPAVRGCHIYILFMREDVRGHLLRQCVLPHNLLNCGGHRHIHTTSQNNNIQQNTIESDGVLIKSKVFPPVRRILCRRERADATWTRQSIINFMNEPRRAAHRRKTPIHTMSTFWAGQHPCHEADYQLAERKQTLLAASIQSADTVFCCLFNAIDAHILVFMLSNLWTS